MLNQISFTNNILMVNTDLLCNSLCVASLGMIILHVQVESSPHYTIQFTTLIFQIKSMNLEQKYNLYTHNHKHKKPLQLFMIFDFHEHKKKNDKNIFNNSAK